MARAGQCMKEPALGCQRTHEETARDPEQELQKKSPRRRKDFKLGRARPGPYPGPPLQEGGRWQEGPGEVKELAA